MSVIRLFCRQALKSMRTTKSQSGSFGQDSLSLEVPYCVQIDGAVFDMLANSVRIATDQVRAGAALPVL